MGEGATLKFSLSPFDGARLASLSEGLEVSVVRLSELSNANPALRFDSEFFGRPNLAAIRDVERHAPAPLVELAERIQHPLEVTREYGDEGLTTLMAGNIRPNRADREGLPRMAVDELTVERNRLSRNDVLLVRTGANFGTVAAWKGGNDVFACADLLVVRSPSVPGGYLSSFLSGRYGERLVKRCCYGSAQPHISPLYIGLVPVPRFGALEGAVDDLVNRAALAEEQAQAALAQAEADLLNALGLAGWSPPEPLTYTRSAAAVAAAGRLDPQYYHPAKLAMLDRLASLPGAALADSFDVIRDLVDPRRTPEAPCRNYDLTDALQPLLDASKEPVTFADMDSAKMRLRDGDLAVARLRSYLREIAVVRVTDDLPSVGSSEFYVLRAKADLVAASAETLMIYLRAAPVQVILKWCQDGSQHPRFSERDLMAIPLPDAVIARDADIKVRVEQAFGARSRSTRLLAAARRAVEVAIEEGEAAALAFVAATREPDGERV